MGAVSTRGWIEAFIEVYGVASTRFGAASRMEYYFDKAEASKPCGCPSRPRSLGVRRRG